MKVDILSIRKDDVVRFSTYSLRVETEPTINKGSIRLTGRIDINGCPIVTKNFMGGRTVTVDRS